MRRRDQIRLAWQCIKHKELSELIAASVQDTVDVMNFKMLTGWTLSEANKALTFGEIEIKETDR